MPRPALTDEQRRQTRRRIRQAAAQLYAENGITDISARAIAKSAGVSVGTLYSYFENLTELMQSLWKEPVARWLSRLEALSSDIDDPRQRLRALLESYAGFATIEHGVYRGAFLFVRPDSLEKPDKLDLEHDRFATLLRNAIREGQQQGQFRNGNPSSLAQTLWAGMHGAIALPANLDRLAFDSAEQLSSNMVELLMQWLEA